MEGEILNHGIVIVRVLITIMIYSCDLPFVRGISAIVSEGWGEW